ncbi:hypothetical protein CDEST_09116 [Colletotrichum destructivum]|uniref:Uncharacterized protein n=1 Tax=Colletotrichum destructivum TaxID=34406 RepID=A0AAX4IL60_9PEZI|nr:hypothetical protein CDEST_09116 [Colletotrichum destructivum]
MAWHGRSSASGADVGSCSSSASSSHARALGLRGLGEGGEERGRVAELANSRITRPRASPGSEIGTELLYAENETSHISHKPLSPADQTCYCYCIVTRSQTFAYPVVALNHGMALDISFSSHRQITRVFDSMLLCAGMTYTRSATPAQLSAIDDTHEQACVPLAASLSKLVKSKHKVNVDDVMISCLLMETFPPIFDLAHEQIKHWLSE